MPEKQIHVMMIRMMMDFWMVRKTQIRMGLLMRVRRIRSILTLMETECPMAGKLHMGLIH